LKNAFFVITFQNNEGEKFESYYRSNINIDLGGKEHYQNIEQDGENV